jgi:hypothetical protein
LDRDELVRLMQGAPDSFRTLRATTRWASDPVVLEEMASRAIRDSVVPQLRGVSRALRWFTASGAVERTAERRLERLHERQACEAAARGRTVQTTRLWIERPDRVREEVEGEHAYLFVSNAGRLVYATQVSGAIEVADANAAERSLLTRGVALAAQPGLEPLGETVVAGRPGVQVRCDPPEPGGGPMRPDERELVVDRECGIVLRDEKRFGGAPFSLFEVVELELDRQLDPSLFAYELGPGVRMRSTAEPAFAVELQLRLEAAASRASFAVFVPREPVGEGMHLVAAATNPAGALVATYMNVDAELSFELEQRSTGPGGETTPRHAQRVDLGGVEAVVTPGRSRLEPTVVELVRDGTHVELSSRGLGRDELLRVASSLEPLR